MKGIMKIIKFPPVIYNRWEKLIYNKTENNPKEIDPLSLNGISGFIIYIGVFFTITLLCSWITSSSLLAIISVLIGLVLCICMIIHENSIISYVSPNGKYIYKIWKPIDNIVAHLGNISEKYILFIIFLTLLFGIYSLYQYFI